MSRSRLIILSAALCMAWTMTAHTEVIAEIHTESEFENAITITEACPIELESAECPCNVSECPETPLKVYRGIELSLEDKSLLAAILWAEANNQCESGQKACVEVVFNRILSDEWPGNLYDVLSQRGQFATWKSRNKVKPTQMQFDVIESVLAETETVLPDTSYVFFDTKGKNGKQHVRIQDHVFGK